MATSLPSLKVERPIESTQFAMRWVIDGMQLHIAENTLVIVTSDNDAAVTAVVNYASSRSQS